MEPARADRQVRVRAPGKVNLGLAVGALGQDGYHPVVSVFQAVSLVEEVTARLGPGLQVTVTGLHAHLVPTDASNLALRAAQLLADRTGIEPAAHLHIHKCVPVSGGMAGGSADAAAALVALDALWETALPREELAQIGSELGADVPFTVLGQTAIGSGRGHLLSPVLARGQFHWVLAVRERGLSTARVYAEFDELTGLLDRGDLAANHELLQALRSGDAEQLGGALHNDLQQAALEISPDLAETFAVAQDAGAFGVVLSGSGPTVAALARSPQHARTLGARIIASGVADDVLYAVGPVPGARVVTGTGGALRDRGPQGLRGAD